MKNEKIFIFLTKEGYTQPPNYEHTNIEIENLQVIGWADGVDADDSFKQLLEENKNLLTTDFNEIFALELAKDFQEQRQYFYLRDYKK